jgi:hypothetical protein
MPAASISAAASDLENDIGLSHYVIRPPVATAGKVSPRGFPLKQTPFRRAFKKIGGARRDLI